MPFGRPFHPLVRALAAWWRQILSGTALGLVAALFSVALLALSGWFIAATAIAGLNTASAQLFNFFLPSIGVRLLAIGRTLARYSERLVSHDATFRILQQLRVWFFKELAPRMPGPLTGRKSGEMLNRAVADIDTLDNLYVRLLSPLLISVATMLVLAGLVAFFDGPAGVLALVGMALAVLVLPWVAWYPSRRASQALARQSMLLRTHLVETVLGLSEWLLFQQQQTQTDRVARAHRDLVAAQRRISHLAGLTAALAIVVAGGTAVAVLVWLAGPVQKGALAGEMLALCLLAVLAAFEIVAPLPAAFLQLEKTREAGRRVLDMVAAPPAVDFPEKGPEMGQPRLAFQNVHFGYHLHDPPVLRGIDLEIPTGACVAIMGPTGAGKSTLIHLLARLYDPQRGQVRLDGHDLRNFTEKDLRRSIGVLSQGAHLFNGTIRENLLLADPAAGDERLWQALEHGELARFVKKSPKKLDTWIGESGQRLSGGQGRRLALARLFLQDAPVWVLDEPTEGLDNLTEQRVLENLLATGADKTMVMITHRLLAPQRMDRIVLLDDGKVAAAGRHNDLLQHSDLYRRMVTRAVLSDPGGHLPVPRAL